MFIENLMDLKKFLRLVSIFSMVGIVILGLSYWSLSIELNEANHKNTEQMVQIESLNTAISLQNDSIDNLGRQTELAQIRAQAAAKVAQANNHALSGAINDIKAMSANSCEESADMVKRAIQELKATP